MDKNKTKEIINILAKNFSDRPALVFSSPYELLIAVMLSAQCTDERVNKVTRELFNKFNTPEKMIKLDKQDLEKYIFSCGLYKTKAEHILSASQEILTKYNGKVPNTFESLNSLSGVGRKTANVVLSVAFHKNAIAVDTHVFRVSKRIGIAKGKTPFEVEKSLMQTIDENDWSRTHHYLIYLGRKYCKAQNPDCKNCPICGQCEKFFLKN